MLDITRNAARLALIAAVGCLCVAHAATKTWTNVGRTQNWSEAENWQGGAPPVNGDRVVMLGRSGLYMSYNDIPNLSLDGIDVSPVVRSGLQLFGLPLTLTGDQPIVVRSSYRPLSIEFGLRLTSLRPTIDVAADPGGAAPLLTLGPLTLAGGTLTVEAAGADVSFVGAINEESTASLTINAATAFLNDSNGFSGALNARTTVLVANTDGSLGTAAGGTTVSSGTLRLNAATSAEPLDLRGTGLGFFGRLTGPIQLTGSQRIEMSTNSEIAGPISGSGALRIDSNFGSVLTLTNSSNAFTGGVVVDAGGLRLGAPEVIPDGDDLTVSSPFAKVIVGASTESVRRFSCTSRGTLEWTPGSGTLRALESVNVEGCSLQLTPPPGYVPPASGELLIIRNEGAAAVSGAFEDMPEGRRIVVNGVDRFLSYRGGGGRDVVLKGPSPVWTLEPVSPPFPVVPVGQLVQQPLSVRAIGAGGAPLANVELEYRVQDCGSASIASMFLRTDANGVAHAPPFRSAPNAGNHFCQQVMLGGAGGAALSMPLILYDPATLVITLSPSRLTVTSGAHFEFTAVVQAGGPNGLLIPGLTVEWEVLPSNGSGAGLDGGSSTTSATGRASMGATDNGVPGSYDIVARVGSVSAALRVAHAGQEASIPSYQDMWWGGLAENGWGMSMVQHRDVIFAVIYAYDAGGNPVWYVMPGGNWDSSRKVYAGALYRPRGAPYANYDVRNFDVGATIGPATLTFSGIDNAVLEATIDGVTIRKSITRQPFGPAGTAPIAGVGDMWWGGQAQNGWGVAVLQQNASLFSVWFTYDAGGAPTWFVMPSGTWTSPTMYEGRLYRTVGSPWTGGTYDPGRLQVIDVGTFQFRFTGDTAVLLYSIDGAFRALELTRQPF